MPGKLISLALVGLVSFGCSGDELSPPKPEVFSGELAVVNIKQLPAPRSYDTDRVILTIEGSTYDLKHVSNQSNLCNSRGEAIGFGTNTLTLVPTYADTNNCDYVRTPQGQFRSVFRGDSLYLGPDTQVFITKQIDTMIYYFRLTK